MDGAIGEKDSYEMTQQNSFPGASRDEDVEREAEFKDSSKEITGEIEEPNTDFSSMQEKIIYSAELSIQVDEYDKTIKDIKQYVKDVKGT